MKIAIISLFAFFCFQICLGQSSSDRIDISLKNKKSKFVKISIQDAQSLDVEGYDGEALIIRPVNTPAEPTDSAATGLKEIMPSIPSPQSKLIAPQILENSQTIDIKCWYVPNEKRHLLIRVPRNTHLALALNTFLGNSKMSVKNFDGELEIRGSASNFEINNITGPLVLNLTDMTTDPGKVSISHINWQKIYAQKKKLPFYILSNYHDVNFSFPENIKVNVNVTCVRGKLFSNLNIINSQTDSNTKDSFSGRLNGGGIPIYIHNENGNVYLRKEN